MVTCLLPLPSHRVLYFHQCGLLFLFCVSSLFILLNLPSSLLFVQPGSLLDITP